MDLVELNNLAQQYYNKKYKHAVRVAIMAMEMNGFKTGCSSEELFAIGLAHDLLEDTKCPINDLAEVLDDNLLNDVTLLTKNKKDSYDDYMKKLITYGSNAAKVVKLADIKDHTNIEGKINEKYLPHLIYLV